MARLKKKPKKAPPAASRTAEDATFRPFARLDRKAAAPKREASQKSAPAAPEEKADPALDVGFAAYMQGVDQLARKPRRLPATVSSLEASAQEGGELPDLDAPARERLAAFVAEGIRFEVIDDGTVIEGRRLDVDPRELRRLRQQRYAIDGRLDLHGTAAEDARSAVARFVARRRREGDRAVLVIHGKGKHSPRGQAVLRGEIGAWLSQGAAARHVLAFASVADPDGASGAVMVLLAKV
jgi:DNA-nicking Smr family endonuclease